ncbi:TPA: hypothetical protein SL854_001688 [Pseudomonas aeruginosa]|uniref:hypothetical protein n=1 Tax=Pseudomonas sp. 273 TaxID=75692 RepID=UPI0023D7E0D2|nr:hypothetical protein [Pseudomonas sp. 273]HEJ6444628.1 hypothetical protein [Pseudomonas aeruginosa]HEJ6470307.1 hypothetical protein [Pseudomonas aeruginosa]
MSKHRPGPWILSEASVLRYGDTKETQICEIFCNQNNKLIAEIPDYCYHADDAEQDMADARLIAAAPDLLSALELVISEEAPAYHDCIDNGEQECAWCIARAAIDKATT